MIRQEAWKLWLAVAMIVGGCLTWLYAETRLRSTFVGYKIVQWVWMQKRAGWAVILGVAMLVLMSGCHASTRCYRLLWWRWC